MFSCFSKRSNFNSLKTLLANILCSNVFVIFFTANICSYCLSLGSLVSITAATAPYAPSPTINKNEIYLIALVCSNQVNGRRLPSELFSSKLMCYSYIFHKNLAHLLLILVL